MDAHARHARVVTMLDSVADFQAANCFVEDYQRPDNLQERREEGLGIAISWWTQWDGLAIMRIFKAALEDSDFHDAAAEVDTMIAKEMQS